MTDSMNHAALPSYVLVTPARNEEAFIQKTIESVIHQTVLPVKWVIVDDGSTDKTAEDRTALPCEAPLDRIGRTAQQGAIVALLQRSGPSMRDTKE